MRDVNGRVRSRTQELDGGTLTAAGLHTSADDVALFKDWLLSPDERDWLLVLDNFDDFQVDVHTFLPVRAEGNVVITTRDRRVIGGIAVSGFALSAIDLLDAERLFLRFQSSGTETVWNEPTSHPEYHVLVQILQEIQYFPLAIDQAASFIRENSPMSLREYLDFLTPRSVDREQLLRFKQANPQYPELVLTTWGISSGYSEQTQPRVNSCEDHVGTLPPLNEVMLCHTVLEIITICRLPEGATAVQCNIPIVLWLLKKYDASLSLLPKHSVRAVAICTATVDVVTR